MKRKLLILSTIVAVAFIGYAAVEPSTITLVVNFTGSTSPSDVRTAKWVVAQENARRIALDPASVPLPTGTAAELKSSFLFCLTQVVNNFMRENASRADEDSTARLTQEELRDIHRAITDRLNSGQTPTQIINLIKP